eukprot:677643-Amphidinium_carterae.1
MAQCRRPRAEAQLAPVPDLSRQSPTSHVLEQHRPPTQAFGAPRLQIPISHPSRRRFVIQHTLQHRLPQHTPPSLSGGARSRSRPRCSSQSITQQSKTSLQVTSEILYDPPDSDSPDCLFACLLFIASLPTEVQQIQDLRRDIHADYATCHLQGQRIAGRSIQQWAAQFNMEEQDYINATCSSKRSEQRPGNTVDVWIASAVLSRTFWITSVHHPSSASHAANSQLVHLYSAPPTLRHTHTHADRNDTQQQTTIHHCAPRQPLLRHQQPIYTAPHDTAICHRPSTARTPEPA